MASKRNAWVSRIAIAVVVVAACFWIARSLGREAVEKLCSKTGLATIERFFKRHGNQSVLIARLLPFVSFDFVSYFAGLTSMPFKGFMVATGIGQLPATIVYSYVGGMLTGGTKMLVTALLILFALAALTVLARQLYREHALRGKEGQTRPGAHALPGDVEPAGEAPPHLVWRSGSLYREGPIL